MFGVAYVVSQARRSAKDRTGRIGLDQPDARPRSGRDRRAASAAVRSTGRGETRGRNERPLYCSISCFTAPGRSPCLVVGRPKQGPCRFQPFRWTFLVSRTWSPSHLDVVGQTVRRMRAQGRAPRPRRARARLRGRRGPIDVSKRCPSRNVHRHGDLAVVPGTVERNRGQCELEVLRAFFDRELEPRTARPPSTRCATR